MEQLISYINDRIDIGDAEVAALDSLFTPMELPAKTVFIPEGKTAEHLYFLLEGIVKGYTNNDGKLVVEHLVEPGNFLTALESFFQGVPSKDSFETILPCKLLRLSKSDLNRLKQSSSKWSQLIELITTENLQCKMERVNDFQRLSAKERYLKFMDQSPFLALNVSVENIASFLGMEPQSLSRIRSQLTS